jgi:hypothetical protein
MNGGRTPAAGDSLAFDKEAVKVRSSGTGPQAGAVFFPERCRWILPHHFTQMSKIVFKLTKAFTIV